MPQSNKDHINKDTINQQHKHKYNMSNYQQQQQSQSQSQQQQQGFVQCITIREFWGDANLNQLCFKVHTQIEVDFSRPPQNGWQWGRIHNLKGWCPEWSITPVGGVEVPPASSSSSPQYSRPPLRRVLGLVQPHHSIIPPHQSQQSRERNSLRRSSDYVTPLQRIVEGNQEHETTANDNDGRLVFDQRTHYNAVGHVPDATTTTINSFHNTKNKWNSGLTKLFSQTKIGIVTSNQKNNETSSASSLSYKNPYTQKQDILESDWTEAPQIMNTTNGRMAIVETDGHTTNYQNKATYQISTKTTDMANQVKTTTSHFAQQLSNWKRSPIVLGRSNMNTIINDDNDQKNSSHNATHNNHKRQPQEEEQQQEQQKNQIRKVVTTNKTEQEPRSSSTTTTTNKYKYKFGDIIMPSSCGCRLWLL